MREVYFWPPLIRTVQIHPYPPLLKENGKYYPATYKTCEHFSPFSKIVPCRLPFPKAVHSTDCVMCLMVFCDYDIVADVLLLKAFCERRFDYGVKTPSPLKRGFMFSTNHFSKKAHWSTLITNVKSEVYQLCRQSQSSVFCTLHQRQGKEFVPFNIRKSDHISFLSVSFFPFAAFPRSFSV